jgi:hypothetical protein
VFVAIPGSGIPITAVGELAVTSGESSVLCCTVQDQNAILKKGVLIHKWQPFDIGLAMNAEPLCNDLPRLTSGELIIGRHFGVHTDPAIPEGALTVADNRYGICVVQTAVEWLGPIALDVAAKEVVDYDVECKPIPTLGIDNQPLTLGRTTALPEFAPEMRSISTDCDPRSVARWSDWWFVVNAEHLTDKESPKTYVGRMSSLLKDMIEAMRADFAVDSAFLDDIKALVLDAERLFNTRRATPSDAAAAMIVLDNATLLALGPAPMAPIYPGSTLPSTLFTNPKGELASHLTALRYAVCSERAHPDDLAMCTMDPFVVCALPPIPVGTPAVCPPPPPPPP